MQAPQEPPEFVECDTGQGGSRPTQRVTDPDDTRIRDQPRPTALPRASRCRQLRLVDALLELGEVAAADAALRRAEAALSTTSSDDRQRAGLLVRRARLHRLAGRREQARRALDSAGQHFEPTALRPERIVWFVESSLVAPRPLLLQQLERLSSDTGVAVPRWERLLLSPASEPVSR